MSCPVLNNRVGLLSDSSASVGCCSTCRVVAGFLRVWMRVTKIPTHFKRAVQAILAARTPCSIECKISACYRRKASYDQLRNSSRQMPRCFQPRWHSTSNCRAGVSAGGRKTSRCIPPLPRNHWTSFRTCHHFHAKARRSGIHATICAVNSALLAGTNFRAWSESGNDWRWPFHFRIVGGRGTLSASSVPHRPALALDEVPTPLSGSRHSTFFASTRIFSLKASRSAG
jgi:hypothetical protein